jgi:valyl-tRNA synthetase
LFDELLELLHPFMPFITEEIYHSLQERKNDLCIKQLKPQSKADKKILQQGAMLKEIISSIRDAKNKNQLKPKDKITLFIQTEAEENYTSLNEILSRQLNAAIHFTHHAHENTIIITIEKDKFYIQTENKIDTAGIKTDLLKDLDYQKNFLQSVLKKLSNERFVQNAKPEMVAMEKKKQADAEARIKTIEESLANFK